LVREGSKEVGEKIKQQHEEGSKKKRETSDIDRTEPDTMGEGLP